MSLIPNTSITASAAGAPLSQSSGSDKQRAAQDSSAQQRTQKTELKAEAAAGIGQTEEDQGASDRDADGRRLWEQPTEGETSDAQVSDDSATEEVKRAKDPSGDSGNSLDLLG